ncbi:hypothetical protein QFW35_004651 [Escherichia coli]|nr:hypothetical protein [Escherichia coli]
MNRIYRVIWNCTLQVFQACSELLTSTRWLKGRGMTRKTGI